MTQFSFEWILSLNWLCQKWGQVQSGTNKLALVASQNTELDILNLVHDSVFKLADTKCSSLWHYADALSRSLEYLPEHEEEEEPTVIYLDGYYDGRPKRAKITIHYDGEKSPQISSHDPAPGKIEGCGSKVVRSGLMAGSENTANYHTQSWGVDEPDRTLQDAIALAKSYIGAQCDDEVRKMDSKWYNAIGGVGHLCILRLDGGFEWMFIDPETKKWTSCTPPVGPSIP